MKRSRICRAGARSAVVPLMDRHWLHLAIAFAALLNLACGRMSGAEANDNFASRQALSGPLPVSVLVNNSRCSRENGEATHGVFTGFNSIRFEWTATSTGAVLASNAYSLYDMHGNVLEIIKTGSMRGGSWNDTLAQARCANKVTLDPQLAHALVGMRLVLSP